MAWSELKPTQDVDSRGLPAAATGTHIVSWLCGQPPRVALPERSPWAQGAIGSLANRLTTRARRTRAGTSTFTAEYTNGNFLGAPASSPSNAFPRDTTKPSLRNSPASRQAALLPVPLFPVVVVLLHEDDLLHLDVCSAKIVMDGVRKVANTGRTIVCTIHQPSLEVLALFDNLLLLKRGGQMVFFGDLGGDDSKKLVQYFEAMPGTSPLRPGANPANWMLECIGAGVGGAGAAPVATSGAEALESDYFVEYFNASPEKQALDETLVNGDGITRPSPNSQQLEFTQKRAADSATQFRLVVGRFMRMYWRTPSYTITGAALSVVLALLFGIIFVDATYSTYQGLNSGIGMLFMTVLFNGFVTLNGVIPLVSRDRAAYYRERASQTYSAVWYFVGSTIAEIPYTLVGLLLFTVVFFNMVGFSGFGNGVLFWLNYVLFILQQAYLGQMWAFLMPSEEVAIVMGLLLNNILYIYTGFSPPYSALPSGYKWLYYANPMRYSLAVAGALAFADCSTTPVFNEATGVFENVGSELGCQPLEGAPVSVGNVTVKFYTEDVFGMKHDEIAQNLGITVAFIVLFRVLGLLALRFVNHQKK